jgi:ribulose kinase
MQDLVRIIMDVPLSMILEQGIGAAIWQELRKLCGKPLTSSLLAMDRIMRRLCCTCQAAKSMAPMVIGWVAELAVNCAAEIRTVRNRFMHIPGLIILSVGTGMHTRC